MIFFAFGILSLLFWAFNWICWLKKCFCFEIFEHYTNKVFVWWLSWIFLCGILACCIAGFVTANRFGFASYAVQCVYERIYYDTINGQLKDTLPRWTGTKGIKDFIKSLNEAFDNLKNLDIEKGGEFLVKANAQTINENFNYPITHNFINTYNSSGYSDKAQFLEQANILLYLGQKSIYNIYFYANNIREGEGGIDESGINDIEKRMSYYKSKFIEDFEYYVHVARGVGQILALIYFSILLAFVVFAGTLLIIYYCNCFTGCNQKYWILPMHITWNVIRFFIFSFFMYGCAYGMFFLGVRDSIAYLQYAFSEENLLNNKVIIPEQTAPYFYNCLFSSKNYQEQGIEAYLIDDLIGSTLEFESWSENFVIPSGMKGDQTLKNALSDLKDSLTNLYEGFKTGNSKLEYFKDIYKKTGSIFSGFNCGFIENNLNLMYRALWDLSWESRILCALSCCIGFFGIISVYSFLWTMYLWAIDDDNNNNDYKPISNHNNNNNNISSPKRDKKRKIKKFIPPPQYNKNDDYVEMNNQNNETEENED